MKSLLRIIVFTCLFVVLYAAFGQSKPTPEIGTAPRTALGFLEKQKQDAIKSFNDAQVAEQNIMHEWEMDHPGWFIDPQTFTVRQAVPSKADEPKPPVPAKKD